MKRLMILLLSVCLLAGCSAPAAPETPSTQEETVQHLSPVYTDWSKLTPYKGYQPLYSYYEPRSADGLLQPQSDYGPLLIYVGTIAALDNYILEQLPLYGLVTSDGQIVTEPIYADISFQGPFLLLSQGEVWGSHEEAWGTALDGAFRYTAAASDGSWVRDLENCYNMFLFGEDQLAMQCTDGSALVLNADGSLAAEFPRSAFEPYLGTDFRWNWEGGPTLTADNGILTVWQYREEVTDGNYYRCYPDLKTGTVSATPPVDWKPFDYSNYVPDETQTPEVSGYNYLDRIVDTMTGKTYYYGSCREGDLLHRNLLDETGQVVLSDCDLTELFLFQPYIRAGLVSTVEDGCFCYVELGTNETVFRYPLRTNSD